MEIRNLEITNITDTDMNLEDLIDALIEQSMQEMRANIYTVLEQMGVTLHMVGDDEEVIDFSDVEEFLKEQN